MENTKVRKVRKLDQYNGVHIFDIIQHKTIWKVLEGKKWIGSFTTQSEAVQFLSTYKNWK